MSEEINVTLPAEPPPLSAVMTTKGQVYQRAKGNIGAQSSAAFDFRPPDWFPAITHDFGPVVLSWPILCASGPLLLLTSEDEFEWLAEQEQAQEIRDVMAEDRRRTKQL